MKQKKKLTGQRGNSFIRDWCLAEVEHLELLQVFADHLEAGVAELRSPEVEVPQSRKFDELLGTGGCDGGEGQAEALEIAQGTAAQQQSHIRVRRAHRQRQLARSALLLLQRAVIFSCAPNASNV